MQAARWLLDNLPSVNGRIAHLHSDSRAIAPGDAFFAYPGEKSDGRAFIDDAVARGAAAVIAEAQGFDVASVGTAPVLAVSQLKQAAGEIASEYYGQPTQHMKIVGITGTSGKTTTAQWTAHCLSALGVKCGVIGTLGTGFVGAQAETGFTTPQAVELQRMFAGLHAQGAQAVAIEVSSIGLAEQRLNGTHFDTAVFTNLSHDHLDYHGSMERYEAAKRALFAWPGLKHAVVNVDDAAGVRLAKAIAALAPVAHLVTCGTQGAKPLMGIAADAELFVQDWAWTAQGASIVASDGEQTQRINLPAFGVFNVANALAVAGVLKGFGFSLADSAGVLASVPPVDGRLNALGGVDAPLVVVDYAHKPDAMEKVLLAMRPVAQQRGGRLVCIFGCGGDRDPSKRPVMAAMACQHADEVVITSDNPRSEDPLVIIAAVKAGVPAGRAVVTQADRALAIANTVAAAAADDVVVIAGKGHETYQEIKGIKYPFQDAEHAQRALLRWQQTRGVTQ
jgi:UDP-N-acetylmuramyl-tripeptide synthetase